MATGLTPRQAEIVYLKACGYERRGIACKLSISVRTVDGHFLDALNRLNCATAIAAIVKSLKMGYIAMPDRFLPRIDNEYWGDLEELFATVKRA